MSLKKTRRVLRDCWTHGELENGSVVNQNGLQRIDTFGRKIRGEGAEKNTESVEFSDIPKNHFLIKGARHNGVVAVTLQTRDLSQDSVDI